MDKHEALPAVKALVYQSASLAGLDVTPGSLDKFVSIADNGFSKIEEGRRPEAIGNLLRLIAGALDLAQERNHDSLHEDDAGGSSDKLCPVYPFD